MTLRVAHCVGFYFPENVGGTEVYVRDLATGLDRFSVESEIVAATDRGYEQYDWAGAPVFRYPANWADIRAESPASTGSSLSKFQELVLRARPDVFHLHSWTAGAGLKHLTRLQNKPFGKERLDGPCAASSQAAHAGRARPFARPFVPPFAQAFRLGLLQAAAPAWTILPGWKINPSARNEQMVHARLPHRAMQAARAAQAAQDDKPRKPHSCTTKLVARAQAAQAS